MGLLNKAKQAITGSDSGTGNEELDEILEDIEDEVEEEEDDVVVEDEIEVDDEPETNETEAMEWDSAYAFAEEFLEPRGFSDGKDFAAKVMMHEIEKSPLYRDRIKTGVNTINQITQATEQLREVRGGSEGMDLEGMATKVESANKVIREVESLEGKEDKMYQEIMGLGHKFAENLMARQASPGGVDAEVNEHDEEL